MSKVDITIEKRNEVNGYIFFPWSDLYCGLYIDTVETFWVGIGTDEEVVFIDCFFHNGFAIIVSGKGYHQCLVERYGHVLNDKEVRLCSLLCANFSINEKSVIMQQGIRTRCINARL